MTKYVKSAMNCVPRFARPTFPLDHLSSIALADYAIQNEQWNGVRDSFPNLFKR